MRSLQKKILVYIILVGVIPMVFMGSIYYRFASEKADEKLNSESYSVLERLETKISEKTTSLQNAADILFSDPEFQKLLRELNLSEGREVYPEIDLYFDKMFRVERKLETIVLFPKSGGVYAGGKSFGDTSPARFVMEYGRISETAGVIAWQGVKPSLVDGKEEQKVVAGTMLRDNGYLKDQELLGNMYFVFSEDIFEDTEKSKLSDAEENDVISHTPSEEITYVYKSGGTEMIYSVGAEKVGNLLARLSMGDAEKIYGSDRGRVDLILDNIHYSAVFYTAIDNGNKYIRVVPHSRYDENYQDIAYIILLCLFGLFVLWWVINYLVVRRITMPMREIVDAMKEVEGENLNVSLKVRSNDEFGIISKQFNKMLATIKNLLERVRNEEKKRKESDVLMLQYQMNPHFLYNTLAAIRVEAIMNKQHNIDKMLLILGRFLRNTIVRGTELTTIDEEISNINDYLSLMQLRYKNQIQISVNVDEEAKEYKIPGMLIQPILENAIMHGLNDQFDSDKPAELKIDVKKTEDNIFIIVYDNGKGMTREEIAFLRTRLESEETEENKHIGLRNIHRRVTMLFGEGYGIDVKSKEGEYTEIYVKLPIIEE